MKPRDGQNEGQKEGRGTLSRRQLLMLGASAGAGLFLTGKMGVRKALAQGPPNCPQAPAVWDLKPFRNRLPIPPYLKPTAGVNSPKYDISVGQFLHGFHKDLPKTPVWGYNGMTPGPTLQVWRGQKIEVTFTNNLESYVLCPDPNVHGSWPVPYVTTHAHGLLDQQNSDGFPEDRFPPGVSYTYEYPNIQRASTYWYHDHGLGVTRLAVMSGLAAFYFIRDFCEARLNLPRGEFEIPLAIQDRSFNADGSLFEWFPWQPEFFGDFAAVNGKVWPYLEVKRGMYRFRILNGSNARFYNLYLTDKEGQILPHQFVQIGSDGGLLPEPVTLTPEVVVIPVPPDSSTLVNKTLLLAPAERADVIIDFAKYPPGTRINMMNDAPAPFPGGGMPPLNTIMQFRVTDAQGCSCEIPQKLCALPRRKPVANTRYVTLVDYGSPFPGYPPPPDGFPYPTLLLNNMEWMDPPTETPKAGSTEIWNIINLAPDTHPIHIHQTQFRILDRRNFDVLAYLAAYGVDGPVDNPTIPFTGPPIPPPLNEAGLKDTVRANPGQVTRLEIPFGPFRGRFVWHCHILDHEDNEMMRPLLIV